MIKISIVIPVYNTEKYLERCLKSVLNQNFKNIEVIIVNDGSLDNSLELIKKYEKKDSRIIVINKKNEGLSSARNAGIKIAKGKYLINIDSDDWIEQNYFKNMYKKAERDNLDIVVSDIIWDYDNGKLDYKKDLDIADEVIIDGDVYLDKFFKYEIFSCVWNKMYRTSLYKENNILHPEGISLGEDLGTTPLLAKQSRRIGKLNGYYIHYIQNIQSITKSNPTKKIYELISAFRILEEKLEVDPYLINSRKIQEIGILIFNSNYNFNENFYKKAQVYYLELFNMKFGNQNYSKKMKLYSNILKKNPTLKILNIIYSVNKILNKIKIGVKI